MYDKKILSLEQLWDASFPIEDDSDQAQHYFLDNGFADVPVEFLRNKVMHHPEWQGKGHTILVRINANQQLIGIFAIYTKDGSTNLIGQGLGSTILGSESNTMCLAFDFHTALAVRLATRQSTILVFLHENGRCDELIPPVVDVLNIFLDLSSKDVFLARSLARALEGKISVRLHYSPHDTWHEVFVDGDRNHFHQTILRPDTGVPDKSIF